MVTSLRQAAEWGMRAIQGGLGRLKTVLGVDIEQNGLLIRTSLHLFNLRTRMVGLNQIQAVFEKNYSSDYLTEKNHSLKKYYNIQ